MYINIREVRLLVGLLLLLATYSSLVSIALGDESGSSGTVQLGSGPRPVYQIGYSRDQPIDVDELIELTRLSSGGGPKLDEGQDTPPSDPVLEPSPEILDMKEADPQPEEIASEKKDAGSTVVQVPVVSNPPGAEVYVDGMFYGLTPTIVTVETGDHLIELCLEGYWNWFNIVDIDDNSRTIPVTFIPVSVNASEPPESTTPPETNVTGEAAPAATAPDRDFWENNYKMVLVVVAFLSFLIGSGSIATWSSSYFATSIKINFPRDGEERWAGMVEGRSRRVYGTKKKIYILVRYEGDWLQVRKKVYPKNDGCWSTRCDVEEGVVYRIYAVITEKDLPERSYLDGLPNYRDISEVGPVTGRVNRELQDPGPSTSR